jgi:hypothetical protein
MPAVTAMRAVAAMAMAAVYTVRAMPVGVRAVTR